LASYWPNYVIIPKEIPFLLLPPVSLVVMWLEFKMKWGYIKIWVWEK
jgi:hypothetical protein